jgi:hypothetical protein
MKVFYSNEYVGKRKRNLLTSTASTLLVYYLLHENGMSYFYIFLAIYIFSVALNSFPIYKYANAMPIAEYDETGITQFFGRTLRIPASSIKSIEYSQHKIQFILQNGTKAGYLLKEMIPHEAFSTLVEYFKQRFPHEYIA